MRAENKTLNTKDNSSYICTGRVDWIIPILAVLISTMEILASINYSSGESFLRFNRGVLVMFIGGVTMLIVSRITYRVWLKGAGILSTIFFLLLLIRFLLEKVGVLTIDYPSWFVAGSAGIYLPIILIALSCFALAAVGEMRQLTDIFNLQNGILVNIIMTTASLYLCIGWKYIFFYFIMTGVVICVRFSGAVPAFIGFISVLIGYVCSQMMAYSWRLEAFLDPSESAVGFEVMNNLYMIHSGGLFGRGIGSTYGAMENGDTFYLISKLIQDMGLVGVLCFLSLFALLFWRIIISITKAPDRIGFYMGLLIFLFFLGRLLCNVMVNLNLIPFVGIHLPFGGVGSHIALIDYLLLGVMMSISRHRIERI